MESESWRILLIDSCEYIYGYSVSYHGGPVLTHKGNCKFCKLRSQDRTKDKLF